MFETPFDNRHLARIEATLHSMAANLHTIVANQLPLLDRTRKIMSTIDTLEADEIALKDAIAKLIGLAGQLLAELQALASSPVVSPDVQAKIDDLHAKFTADLGAITSAVSADSTPITPPSPTLPAPTITGIEPAAGAAGDAVVITGAGFTGATALDFGGAAVANTDFSVVSDTEIHAVVPADGSGRVTVTTANGASNAGVFSYGGATPPADSADTTSAKRSRNR